MRVAIMQPTFLPWIGYFDLIDRTDTFVFLDTVKYSRQSWQQRNRVKTASGLQWLTLPVQASEREGTTIAEARLGDVSVLKKHQKTVEQAYRKAPYFARYFAEFSAAVGALRPGDRLLDFSVGLIEWACQSIGISTRRVLASSLAAAADRHGRLVDLCHGLGADTYISPVGALDYMEDAIPAFDAAGIRVLFHAYAHPQYPQLHPPFAPYAGVIDLLMNCGPESLAVVRSGRLRDLTPMQMRELGAASKTSLHGDST